MEGKEGRQKRGGSMGKGGKEGKRGRKRMEIIRVNYFHLLRGYTPLKYY